MNRVRGIKLWIKVEGMRSVGEVALNENVQNMLRNVHDIHYNIVQDLDLWCV